ncbi:glycosyltransferase family 2 protein [Glaciecola siphonariae]|uniref:Glycosyltransferase family 2 protein n=1 Tax=Glaciecola siphonariae TaxID=521012 RepID=A0ABV9M005_9ALTE
MGTHQEKLMTIGFPTYNRKEIIRDRLTELYKNKDVFNFEILVIDNASTDGTYDLLTSEFRFPNLTIMRNNENIGLGRNMLRLFNEVKTQWLAISSDEDLPLLDEHKRLLNEYYEKENCDLIIGSVLPPKGNPTGFLRNKVDRVATASDVHETNYMSGLLYKVSELRESIQLVNDSINTNNFVELYPHRAIALHAFANNHCTSVSTPLSERKAQKESALEKVTVNELQKENIAQKEVLKFSTLPERWEQWKSCLHFLMRVKATSKSDLSKINTLITYHCSTLLSSIRTGVAAEDPRFAEAINCSMFSEMAYFLQEHGKKTEQNYERPVAVLRQKARNSPDF